MRDFEAFMEAQADRHQGNDSSRINALEDMAEALRKVFKKYSRQTRQLAWQKLISRRGQQEVEKLMHQPTRSTNRFRTLWSECRDFDSWLLNLRENKDL